jgi:peptidoglycan/LPS O-acetylase OafA/YrhL
MKEIKPLTTMRGAFALWVLGYHIAFNSGMPRGEPFLAYGYLGVEFFFLLSGFILAGAYGNLFAERWTASDYTRFMRARFRRLFPLHLTVLGVVVVIAIMAGRPIAPWPLASEATLTNMWWPGVPRLNGLDWSLSTELAANILLPILAVLALRKTRTGFAVACFTGLAAITALLAYAKTNGWSLDDIQTSGAMIRCFCEFTMGMLIYRFRESLTLVSSDLVLTLLGLALVALVGARSHDLLIVAVLATGLAGLASNRGRVAKLLSWPPFHYLGKISFSVYLVQSPVNAVVKSLIGEMGAPARYWVFALAAVTGTIAVSSLTYRHIELRFKNSAKPRPSLQESKLSA